MPRFIVSEKVLVERSYTVEAESREEALQRAWEGDVPFDSEEEIGPTQWDAEIQGEGAPPSDAIQNAKVYCDGCGISNGVHADNCTLKAERFCLNCGQALMDGERETCCAKRED